MPKKVSKCVLYGSVRKPNHGKMAKGGTIGYIQPLSGSFNREIAFSSKLDLSIDDWVEYVMVDGVPTILRKIPDKASYKKRFCKT